MKRILKSAIPVLLSLAIMTGCIKETRLDRPQISGGETLVAFHVELPALEIPATRAVDQTETEASINNIYVLIFDKDDEFLDKKIVTQAQFTTETGDAKAVKSFTIALPLSKDNDNKYNITLLANVTGDLATAINAFTEGDDRETVLATLTQTYTGNPAIPVPMASVPKTAVKIDENTSFTGANGFSMIRMVSRIDVSLAGDIAVNYSVARVLLYNYNTIGRVWTNNFSGTKVNGVTLPSTPETSPAGSKYAVSNGMDGSYWLTNFSSRLYALEAEVANVGAERPCIVVELADKDGNSMGHYRADFQSSNDTYLDLLRNHRYLFNITKIHGTGFGDPDVAYNSTNTDLDCHVIEWNESDMREIYVNGDYWLSLSGRNLELDEKARTVAEAIKILTNVTTGWTLVGVYNFVDDSPFANDGSDWITCKKNGDHLKVEVKENKNTSERKAYAIVKAGSVTAKINITQSPKVEVSLKILNGDGTEEISELVFEGNDLTAQPFKVRWTPNTEDVNISIVSDQSLEEFKFDDASQFKSSITSASGGEVTFKVTPTALNVDPSYPFAERLSSVNFSVSSLGGDIEKNLLLRQINYALTVNDSQTPAAKDVFTDIEDSLTIKCNTEWTVTKGNYTGALNDGNVSIIAGSGNQPANIGGFTFKYKIAKKQYGSVTFTFTPKTGTPVSITISSKAKLPVFALSNIIWDISGGDGGKLTFAEDEDALTSRNIRADAQGLLFKWGSLIGIAGQGQKDIWSEFKKNDIITHDTWLDGFNKESINNWTDVPRCEFITDIDQPDLDAFFDKDKGIYKDTGGFDERAGKGDICRFISSKGWVSGNWRMPTSEELQEFYETGEKGASVASKYGWRHGESPHWVEVNQQTLSMSGKTSITNGWSLGPGITNQEPSSATHEKVYFPATGWRTETNGILKVVGVQGLYWSSSHARSREAGTGWALPMTIEFGGAVFENVANENECGLSVRCVRAE